MKRIIPLIGILVIGAYLRVFMLSSLPPSLTWDEASWGYNAYSLGIDGRDEFGRLLPLTSLESFGDYKPPIYAYLTAPVVRVFGLNEWTVRFPSAFLGTLTILLTYLLTKRIFFTASDRKREAIALVSALILAISPWHILLSRAAFEANVATFFIVLGTYLFLYSFDKRWLLPVATLSLIASMYAFNSARVFVPLFGFFLFLKYFKVLLKDKKSLVVSFAFGLITFLPLFLFLLTPQAKLRYNEVNIFSDSSIVTTANQQIANDGNKAWSNLIHNRRVGYGLAYIKHYLDNLNPQFLFISGDGNPKFSIQDVGQMYIWEIPFFLLGMLFLFRKREGHWLIIPLWILLGLAPAGVARETPHALRIETVIPTFQILTAYGLFNILGIFNRKSYRINALPVVMSVICFFAVFNFLYFVHNYFVHYSKEFSGQWQYGYREAIGFINDNERKYDKIYMTESLGRPYIYYLFYSRYSPQKFREDSDSGKDALGFMHVTRIGKLSFRDDLNKGFDSSEKNLFIGDPARLRGKLKILREFKQLDGTTILVAYEKRTADEKTK